MLFQETQLDDGMTIDSRSCGTTNTTTAASSYDSNKVKVNYKNKKKNVSTKHKNHFLLESISIHNNEKKYKFDYIKDLQLS
jgi:hypothetical protein